MISLQEKGPKQEKMTSLQEKGPKQEKDIKKGSPL